MPKQRGFFDRLNSQRAAIRDTIAFAIAHPGQGAEGDPGARSLHEAWMRDAATKLSGSLRPGAIRALLGTVGKANEGLSGVLSWLGGHGFYGDAGYDQGDVDANTRGIEAGLSQPPPGLPPLRDLTPEEKAAVASYMEGLRQ